MAPNKSKLVAGTMFALCGTLALAMGLYLPFYSSVAKQGEEARRQLHAKDLGVDRAPGGVWKNLNNATRSKKQEGAEGDENEHQ